MNKQTERNGLRVKRYRRAYPLSSVVMSDKEILQFLDDLRKTKKIVDRQIKEKVNEEN